MAKHHKKHKKPKQHDDDDVADEELAVLVEKENEQDGAVIVKGKDDDDDHGHGHANEEEQQSDDKKERKRKRKQRKEEKKARKRLKRSNDAIHVDDDEEEDDSSVPPEHQSGGESTAQQAAEKKAKEGSCHPVLLEDEGSVSKTKKSKKDKKKKSKKKKKKDKDKNTKRAASDDDDSCQDDEADGGVLNNKKENKKEVLEAQHRAESKALTGTTSEGRIVASSAIEFYDEQIKQEKKRQQQQQQQQQQKDKVSASLIMKPQEQNNITLLLFYQYIEPVWDEATYNFMLKTLQELGPRLGLTGRMRVAREGLNCTLTSTHEAIVEYCATLRKLRPTEFASTEFKLTTDLPLAQKFPNLKVFKVVELVHYGLEGRKAPPIAKFQGTHLEPKDYHEKIAQPNTVIIDVRNHYEAAIGRFVPPSDPGGGGGRMKKKQDESGDAAAAAPPPPQWLDPKMRKSTEFPVWLDKPETKEMMKGKQVLMYCTGGIRCERASALLKYKMETDPEIKELGIQGVYQLQGGIDKYFKEFPDGGYWQGKNYVFDKRFAHAPPKVDGELHGKAIKDDSRPAAAASSEQVMGKCEACQKPWDMYRGKRRCPTCGVPSLICRECFLADKEGRKKLGKQVRCDLCVEQGITSKYELRQRDQVEIEEYERKMAQRGLLQPEEGDIKAPNPDQVTRLQLKNMCRKNMDEATLIDTLPGITHIVWRLDRKSGNFLGQGWVEMATPDDAARAVARDGKIKILGRPLYISYQPPDGKDAWPPSSSAVDPNLYRK